MSVYIFYHIYCSEETATIVNDQIIKIQFSGLYETVTQIFCFLAGNRIHVEKIIKILEKNGSKFIIKCVGINDTSFERFTIHKIKNYIKSEDKFLYLHSKGTTRSGPAAERMFQWRTLMEFFVMGQHKKCLELLNEYDTVGVNWLKEPFLHYSGNFWWSNGSYFLTLPSIDISHCEGKHAHTECYIGMKNPKMYCLFSSHINHYYSDFPAANFIDNSILSPDEDSDSPLKTRQGPFILEKSFLSNPKLSKRSMRSMNIQSSSIAAPESIVKNKFLSKNKSVMHLMKNSGPQIVHRFAL